MKFLFTTASLAAVVLLLSFVRIKDTATIPSPLASYSPEWEQAKYLKCNTASRTKYMSPAEKEIIYILNMARMNPTLFTNTVVKHYPNRRGESYLKNNSYYKSLLDTLPKVKPQPLLFPDSLCYVSASCHALSSGAASYVGHERTTEECRKKEYFDGECCHYGFSKPLDIVMSLLIDDDVPSLGHRKLLLSGFRKTGVALRSHQSYSYNTVIDLSY